MGNKKQGVQSRIYFPLGQDEIAITQAIFCLLEEGWKFVELEKTNIVLERFWEYDPDKKEGQVEVARSLTDEELRAFDLKKLENGK